MRPHAPDIELIVAAGRFLLWPGDGTSRLHAAIAALDGVPMNASLRALWDAAALRLAGGADDGALRTALIAYCESHVRRRAWEDAVAFPAPGATHVQRSHREDML